MLFAALLVPALGLPAHAQMREILVVAAVSLEDALNDANVQYRQLTGRKVLTSYAASGKLAKQIENGAPADIFISADVEWMDYLAKLNLIKPETRFNFLGNKLVLIKRAGSTVNLTIGPNFPLARHSVVVAWPSPIPLRSLPANGKTAHEALGV
jgi:molybdate transport system substrate-binding protein